MFKNLILGSLLLLCLKLPAQTIQWADQVLDFSSELSPLQYSAQQALGQPNVSLKGGDSPNAWSPRRNDRTDYIKVGFENPIKIQQIAIHESFNPGAVYQVFTYDGSGNEYEIFTIEPRVLPIGSRVLNFFFEMTDYDVHAIKVIIDGQKVPGENSIDAIGMSDSNIPISVTIQIAENVNMELETERLSENVNSSYIEHSPILSPDGKTLFFSRANHPENVGGEDDNEDIWFSEWDEQKGEWKEAKNMGKGLNTKGPNFISSVSADGNSIVLLLGNQYTKNGKMKAGVSISSREGEDWSEPKSMEITNDYNYSLKADYFLSNDKKAMLMSVERDDTYGYRDLYVSFEQNEGKWSEPLNLGSTINTANEESSPFLDDDGVTLYFSSNGFSGYGGTDIYVAKRLDDTWINWTQPENMGSGVNSEEDDIYFTLPQSGDYGYLTKGDREKDVDIFQFQKDELYMPPKVIVKGKVLDSETNLPLAAEVIVEKLPDGEEVLRTSSNPKTGEFQFELDYGSRYGYRAEVDGYIAVNENIDLNEPGEAKEIESNLVMKPVKVEIVVVLNNIFFDFDKSRLKTSSIPELDRVVGYFNDKVITEIEVAGHTCDIGTTAYNQGLSERRAKAVASYITSQGVSQDKVKVVWFGEANPTVPNSSPENRRKNRRVEFKILEK